MFSKKPWKSSLKSALIFSLMTGVVIVSGCAGNHSFTVHGEWTHTKTKSATLAGDKTASDGIIDQVAGLGSISLHGDTDLQPSDISLGLKLINFHLTANSSTAVLSLYDSNGRLFAAKQFPVVFQNFDAFLSTPYAVRSWIQNASSFVETLKFSVGIPVQHTHSGFARIAMDASLNGVPLRTWSASTIYGDPAAGCPASQPRCRNVP